MVIESCKQLYTCSTMHVGFTSMDRTPAMHSAALAIFWAGCIGMPDHYAEISVAWW
jgi:hypothetical protein